MLSSKNGRRRRGLHELLVTCIFSIVFNIYLSDAQISPVQQIHFVPKSYFLQASSQQAAEPVASPSELEFASSPQVSLQDDITRNPRHLAPDRYYVGPDPDQTATATTSLRTSTLDRSGNPINFNDDLDQELKLDISNDNPNNNQFEAKILPNPTHQSIIPRKPNRGKNRRTKTRPPKNVIIYSLPEQSFYANGESSYSEPDSRESSGLRSDLGDGVPEEQQQPQTVVADSKEFRTTDTNSNLISQKKALLGQCMAQCIDAILS